MLRNFIYTLIIFFATTFISWGQTKETTPAARKSINEHIKYLNYCADYIGTIKFSLEDYNSKINTYYKSTDLENVQKQHIPFVVQLKNIPGAIKWDTKKLDALYNTLAISRKQMTPKGAQTLETSIINYQKHFKQLITTLETFTLLTNNKSAFYKDNSFIASFELMVSIEKSIEKLTLQNDLLFDVVLQVFGDETLPEALERSKHIAFLYKKMIQEFRSEKKDNLPTLSAHFKRISAAKNTPTGYKILENFGDYNVTDTKQIQKRENIELQAAAVITIIENYINNELAPCDTKKLKNYGAYYCWLNRVNNFHDASKNTIGSYNTYASRANTPVLLLIQELRPFKVFLPEEIISLRQEVKLPTIQNTITTNIPTTIKTSSFNQEDITSLEGALNTNLVLLLDISASMRLNDNEEKLKKSIIHLINLLRPEDKLSIISYSGVPKKVFETYRNYDKEAVKTIVSNLKSNGNTDANAGLKMAYEICLKNYNKDKNNRIIIASDGGFWVNDVVKDKIYDATKSNISLSTFHYISEKSKGTKILKELAILGKGNYQLIKEESDAISTLIKESKQQ